MEITEKESTAILSMDLPFRVSCLKQGSTNEYHSFMAETLINRLHTILSLIEFVGRQGQEIEMNVIQLGEFTEELGNLGLCHLEAIEILEMQTRRAANV